MVQLLCLLSCPQPVDLTLLLFAAVAAQWRAMATIWIEATLALDIAANGGSKTSAVFTVCERAYAGLIRTKAKNVIVGDEQKGEGSLPKTFWWAKGHEALEQNWTTGDFATWIDGTSEIRAFGVRFALDDILELLPVELRAMAAKRYSVAGNPDWISAKEACRLTARREMIPGVAAGRKIIEQAKLGFVTARAVEMHSTTEGRFYSENIEREWDIPIWFWQQYCEPEKSSQNWETGKFKGRSYRQLSPRSVELCDVHFLKSTIEVESPSASYGTIEAQKPDLPRAELERWWASMVGARDALTQDQLLLLVRDKYPDNHIARDRIRQISGGRKPGKKSIGG